MDKLGIRNEKIKSGEHKDILSMFRPMTEEERALLQQMVNDIYGQFVRVVADGRGMDEAKVRSSRTAGSSRAVRRWTQASSTRWAIITMP